MLAEIAFQASCYSNGAVTIFKHKTGVFGNWLIVLNIRNRNFKLFTTQIHTTYLIDLMRSDRWGCFPRMRCSVMIGINSIKCSISLYCRCSFLRTCKMGCQSLKIKAMSKSIRLLCFIRYQIVC